VLNFALDDYLFILLSVDYDNHYDYHYD